MSEGIVSIVRDMRQECPHRRCSTDHFIVFARRHQRAFYLVHFPWTHKTMFSKRHLDRFSRFCGVHWCAQQIDIETDNATSRVKGSPYSINERRVPQLIPVLGNQPAGDASHKTGSRLPLLSARSVVTPATLKRAATNFAAW